MPATARMKAAKLRHRVTIQSPTGTRDAVGERTTTWIDVARVFADIQPFTAREQFLAAQMQSSNTHTVTIRYSAATAAITGAWRVLYRDRVLVVDTVSNLGERDRTVELKCTEGLRQK